LTDDKALQRPARREPAGAPVTGRGRVLHRSPRHGRAVLPRHRRSPRKMVYGKRAASSLHSLAETLKRRRDGMGTQMPSAAAVEADPGGDDPATADEARIVHEGSKSAKAEKREIDALLARLQLPSSVLIQRVVGCTGTWPDTRCNATASATSLRRCSSGERPVMVAGGVIPTMCAARHDHPRRRLRAAGSANPRRRFELPRPHPGG